MITENVRTVIDVVVILVGIPALYDLSKKIRSRFWRSNSGVPPPPATNLVSGSAFALSHSGAAPIRDWPGRLLSTVAGKPTRRGIQGK